MKKQRRVPYDTAPTASVDARLLVKPRTFGGAFACTAYAGASSPDMKRPMERAAAADTGDEILYVQLSTAHQAMNTQLQEHEPDTAGGLAVVALADLVVRLL